MSVIIALTRLIFRDGHFHYLEEFYNLIEVCH